MSDSIRVSQVNEPQLVTVSAFGPAGFLAGTWQRWKKIARAVGVVQTRLLMVTFYFLVVLPLGLFMRMRGDPLHLKPTAGSNWTPHRSEKASLESARRQF